MEKVKVWEHIVELSVIGGPGRIVMTIFRQYRAPIAVAEEARKAMVAATGVSWEVTATRLGGRCEFLDVTDSESIERSWGRS
ncbi:hypothetical protein [Burkholderia ubonensis]|uniref:hypothetical protein n=1 Tax=Burkholderia ubonensis TaxID=101571 RepID=UPI000F57E0CE|nr:hypothetical protein [Burkholderia ubonensis]RQP43144.1 hypothetical protein DF155_01180 [Burkholderia ubonensis]RQP44044.1 hypothetical protein DF154_07545 [Burkholderia ubonensis]RQP46970.1 hypothetical protein DF156_01700 [Burkholderia ubonensis]RQP60372.1 hypothetical protein DF144_04210 [Burkholderia ubonensis]RQP66417.1 hypothetical protein DF151_02785 [Burkholderia ubonensis]